MSRGGKIVSMKTWLSAGDVRNVIQGRRVYIYGMARESAPRGELMLSDDHGIWEKW